MSASERKAIVLDQIAVDALIGILLSDGHLNRRSPTGNTRFMFAQSGKPEKHAYFQLVFNLFANCLTSATLAAGVVIKPLAKGSDYIRISFATIALPCFNEFYSLFYLDGVKVVPDNIGAVLTPCGLAHWIMGDGSKQNHGLHLSVYAFSDKDVQLLMDALTQMGLECSIHNHAMGPRIYIPKGSMPRLVELVSPFMVPNMMYKLSL